MKISKLFKSAGIYVPSVPDNNISDIIFDSRKASPNSVFVALRGDHTDGHLFIEKALSKGCPVAVSEENGFGKSVVVVKDTTIALANLSHALNGYPSKSIQLCGVTGTNGKTTITHMLAHMLRGIDNELGLVGTAGHIFPGSDRSTEWDENNPKTTPPITILDSYFKTMVEHGSKYGVLELSNFGLERGRLIGYEFETVAISNITYNHHVKLSRGFDNYVASKMMAVDLVKQTGTVVLNIDDDYYDVARKHAGKKRLVTFGHHQGDIHIKHFESGLKNSKLAISTFENEYKLELPIAGLVNAINVLTAVGMLDGLGFDMAEMLPRMTSFKPINGRWNWVERGQPFPVVIDKANTAKSIEFVLSHLKEHCQGKLYIILYIVGDGDFQARKYMADIVAKYADLTITTYGLSQGEDLDFTLNQFADFLDNVGADHIEIPHRPEAIDHAISIARDDDCVAILARGNQKSMTVKGKFIKSDFQSAIESLKRRGYKDESDRL